MSTFRKITATISAANKSKKNREWAKNGEKSADQNSSFKHQVVWFLNKKR